MNAAAMKLIKDTLEAPISGFDSRKESMLRENLSYILNRSEEMTENSLLYFSVNGLILRSDSDYCLLVFEDVNPHSHSINPEDAHLERAYSYIPIQTVCREFLFGHSVFETLHIDCHTVFLLSFPIGSYDFDCERFFGLLNKNLSLMIKTCKDRYDVECAAYYSPIVHGIKHISRYYRIVEDRVNLDRFLRKKPTVPQAVEVEPKSAPGLPAVLEECSIKFCEALRDGSDIEPVLREISNAFLNANLHTTEELKIHFAAFVTDSLYNRLPDVSVFIDEEKLHQSLAGNVNRSMYWEQMVEWLRCLAVECARKRDRQKRHRTAGLFMGVKEYIDNNYGDCELNVAFLCRQFQLSQSYLSSGFKRQYRCTVSEYLLEKRLNRAQDMLLETTDPIKEIYSKCGFGSIETFYRLFRKRYRISPNAYRKARTIISHNNPLK